MFFVCCFAEVFVVFDDTSFKVVNEDRDNTLFGVVEHLPIFLPLKGTSYKLWSLPTDEIDIVLTFLFYSL